MNKKSIALIKLVFLCVAVLTFTSFAPNVYELLFGKEISDNAKNIVVVISLMLLALGAGYFGKHLK